MVNQVSFPYIPDGTLEIIETHISRVFLAEKFAYKQKKPVDYGFVDYTTLEKRIFYARKELSLNRRACSGIYLDIVELRQKKGEVFAGYKGGKLIDVLVRMRRVDPALFLSNIIKTGEGRRQTPLSGPPREGGIHAIIKKSGQRIYLFHKNARASKRISGFGSLKTYRENWDDNFLSIGGLFSERGRQGVKTGEKFNELRGTYEGFLESRLFREFTILRRKNGFIRDVHGDLRMEHIAAPPRAGTAPARAGRRRAGISGICLMDCVEFDERYRCQDLYLDAAFLLMDFEYNGFFYESASFFDFYKNCFNYARSIEPYEKYEKKVIPFFKAYRAVVRTKIALLSGGEEDAVKYAGLTAFYFRLLKKPVVILNCGLPGSGKSVISGLLSRYFYAAVFSSDKIRRDLYGGKDNALKYGRGGGETDRLVQVMDNEEEEAGKPPADIAEQPGGGRGEVEGHVLAGGASASFARLLRLDAGLAQRGFDGGHVVPVHRTDVRHA